MIIHIKFYLKLIIQYFIIIFSLLKNFTYANFPYMSPFFMILNKIKKFMQQRIKNCH